MKGNPRSLKLEKSLNSSKDPAQQEINEIKL